MIWLTFLPNLHQNPSTLAKFKFPSCKKTFCDVRHKILMVYFAYLMLSDHFVWCSSSPSSPTSISIPPSVKHFKCDFDKFPEAGCADSATSFCNNDTNQCVCRAGHPVNVNGRCFAIRDIDELCVTTRQCSRIKAKCIDNAGEEVVSNDNPSEWSSQTSAHELNTRMVVGTCKCHTGRFYHQDKKECSQRVLGNKCLFQNDCYSRSHSFCDGTKCKCKNGFFHDFVADECRPSIVALCMFGYVFENGTQKCRPARDSNGGTILDGRVSGHSPLSSSLSALFWPIIAFFLVILLLKMLKEGMRRDCERAAASVAADHDPTRRGRRTRPHHHHRNLGPHGRAYRHYPSEFLPSLGLASTSVVSSPSHIPPPSASTSDTRRSRAPEIIVLMPPPPYSATPNGPEVTISHPEIGEQPPSYEEATRK